MGCITKTKAGNYRADVQKVGFERRTKTFAEAQLYNDVTAYVKEEMNRADQLDGKRKGTVGFALTALQRRLASSPEAILQRCAN
jgi:hypothetical protein